MGFQVRTTTNFLRQTMITSPFQVAFRGHLPGLWHWAVYRDPLWACLVQPLIFSYLVSFPTTARWASGQIVDSSLLVRGILGLSNAVALVAFARSVEKAFGTGAGIWYALLQASQFHVNYYASRTLPNIFALILSKLEAKATPTNWAKSIIRHTSIAKLTERLCNPLE